MSQHQEVIQSLTDSGYVYSGYCGHRVESQEGRVRVLAREYWHEEKETTVLVYEDPDTRETVTERVN